MVTVRALQNCFVDNQYRVAGTVFDYKRYDPKTDSSVMMPVEDEKPKKRPRASRAKPAEQPAPEPEE